MDDNELIESVLRGNTNDFGLLVERYSAKIYRICLSLCGNHADAEDATQEAFIDSFRYLASLSDKNKFYPWLCMIARRKSYKQLHSRVAFADIDEMEEFLAFDYDFTDSGIREERRDRVRKAVEKMSEKRRQVCEMFYFRNMKISEIALRLSLPEATVKSRLYDVREYLRKELCDMNTNKENISSLEERIKEQIKTLSYYYSLNKRTFDKNYNDKIKEVIGLVDKINDEQTKQYYLSDVLTLQSFAEKDEDKRKNIVEHRNQAAKAGKNIKRIADMLIDEYFNAYNTGGKEKALKFIDEIAFPTIKEYESVPEYDQAKGELSFWRGRTLLSFGRLDEAKEDFITASLLIEKSNAYQANAVAAIRDIDTMKAKAYDAKSSYDAAGEGIIFKNGKLIFHNQPGYSYYYNIPGTCLDFNSFTYYTSKCDNIIFDTNMKPGDVIKDQSGASSLECISYNETVSVIAGSFENCLHTKTVANSPWNERYTYDVWYAPGVGLVKVVSNCKGETENYELVEYTILGGDGYMPLAVGNRWVYRNPNAPSYVYHDIERTVEYTDGCLTNFAVNTPITLLKDFESCEDIDSYLYLYVADKLCDEWKISEAIEMLKKAVRLNIDEEAVRISLYAIEVLSRFEEYQKKGYRFCPSSIGAFYVQSDENTVSEGVHVTNFGPYRWGARGRYEDRIFGIKPFRYLNGFMNVLWDSKWVPGYHEEKTVKDGLKFFFTVEDGGTVTVPSGTFENCRKITLRIDKPEDKDDIWFYENNYANMDAGIKEYWFAPGVGIVKIISVWGTTCNAECVLKAYNTPASKESEYLPIHIGNRWEYEETHLAAEGYRASAIFSIASGMNGKYLMNCSQEFVCFKTEDEYNEFMKSSHQY